MDVVEVIRRDGDPMRSARLPELYDLARRDGEGYLQRCFRDVPASDRADHVHDVLARRLREIVAADNPRALFLVALRHRVISAFRRPREVLGDPDHGGASEAGAEQLLRVEIAEALAVLLDEVSPRDAAVFLAAVTCDDDIDVIAAAFGLSTANVYTIVARTRKKLRAAAGRAR